MADVVSCREAVMDLGDKLLVPSSGPPREMNQCLYRLTLAAGMIQLTLTY